MSDNRLKQDSIESLLEVMARLRDPDAGCPWDLKQDFASIVPYTLEEAYEVAHAIETHDWGELREELGDLLFQVVFYAQLGKEQRLFDFDDIVEAVTHKLIRRHPHVFADQQGLDEAQIKANWEKFKAEERRQKAELSLHSVLDNVPQALPALSRAAKLQKRCASVGFDWPDTDGVIDKIREEVDELEAELDRGDHQHDAVAEELGDLMFALVNLSRFIKRDPEQLLREANNKFERRFRDLEKRVNQEQRAVSDCSLDELEGHWQAVKLKEKKQ